MARKTVSAVRIRIGLDDPLVSVVCQAADGLACMQDRPLLLPAWRSSADIQHAAGQAQRRERQGGFDGPLAMDQADPMDRGGAEGRGINTKRLSPLDCVLTEEVAADLVSGASGPFDQDRLVTGPGQGDGGGSAGRAGADDQRVPTHRRNGIYQATNACCSLMPAWRSSVAHSARRKARAIEIWPSSRTKRCHKARRARIGNP